MSPQRFLIVLILAIIPLSARAQFTDSGTGLLSAPSADLNRDGMFTITNNYLNEKYLPRNGWDYSTFSYGFGITFWSRVEVDYVCTLFWGDWSPKAQSPQGTYREKIMKNQDRHFAGKILVLREGEIWKWTPSIAVGFSDPVTSSAGDYIKGGRTIGASNGYFNRAYVVATKHFETPIGTIGGHLGYQVSMRVDWERTGLVGGIDWSPVWLQNRWFNPKFIFEYNAETFNGGFIAGIWDDRFEAMFCLQDFKYISFGLRFKLRLAGSL